MNKIDTSIKMPTFFFLNLCNNLFEVPVVSKGLSFLLPIVSDLGEMLPVRLGSLQIVPTAQFIFNYICMCLMSTKI